MFLLITSFAIWLFFFLRREGGYDRRLALGSHAISRGIFLSRRIFVFLWGPKVGVTGLQLKIRWLHMSDLASPIQADTCCLHAPDVYLFWCKIRHKLSVSCMDCAKTLKSISGSQLSQTVPWLLGTPGVFQAGQILLPFKFWFHMHSVLKLFGETLPFRYCASLDYYSLTELSLEAKFVLFKVSAYQATQA